MAIDDLEEPSQSLNRRQFICGAASVASLPLMTHATDSIPSIADKDGLSATSQTVPMGFSVVTLRVNQQSHVISVDSRTTLLDALRDHLGLCGTKKGCAHGQCGACTVHVDGQRMLFCLSFAVMNDGRDITTIEGLANSTDKLHPMQQAFVDHDAFQCGYCTPGQIMSAVACVHEGHANNAQNIREYMSGNICRCAAYPNIVAAIQQAQPLMKKS